jgi:hypothetical protein
MVREPAADLISTASGVNILSNEPTLSLSVDDAAGLLVVVAIMSSFPCFKF